MNKIEFSVNPLLPPKIQLNEAKKDCEDFW